MSCRDCKHVSRESFPDPHGACHRFPPTALNETTSTFPVVHLDKFSCGEFAKGKRTASPMPKNAGISRRSSK